MFPAFFANAAIASATFRWCALSCPQSPIAIKLTSPAGPLTGIVLGSGRGAAPQDCKPTSRKTNRSEHFFMNNASARTALLSYADQIAKEKGGGRLRCANHFPARRLSSLGASRAARYGF